MTTKIIAVLSCIITIFFLYTAGFGEVNVVVQRGLPFMIALLATILSKSESDKNKYKQLLSNCILLGGIIATGYLIIFCHEIYFRIGMETNVDIIVGVVGTLAVLELGRRTCGNSLLIIALAFIAYGFLGPYIPGPLAHKGFNISRMARFIFLSVEGVFGMALGVVCSFVSVFVVYGAILGRTGGGKFFTDVAYGATRRMSSGPAQAAVLSSCLFGSISGSAVANVVGTGTFTIPLMKKTGYKPEFAAGVEAAASTGGQLMPPILGAAAFLMSEISGISYTRIALSALIPALLYYAGVSISVYLQAKKRGLGTEEDVNNYSKIGLIEWRHVISIAVLVYFLARGYSPGRVAFYGSVVALVVCWITILSGKQERLSIRGYIDICRETLKGLTPLIGATALVGVIIGIVTMTGIGNKFSEAVLLLGHDKLSLALVVTMVASLILGMGLPTTAAYALLAIIVVPGLVQMGVPLLSAHMFVFYFGTLSAITPPVALASYTAAGIAQADQFKTAWTSCMLALPGFIVPFTFVYNPALLMIGTTATVVLSAITALAGVFCLGISTIGFMSKPLLIWERVLLGFASVLLIIPGWSTDLLGLIVIAGVIVFGFLNKSLRFSNRRSNNG